MPYNLLKEYNDWLLRKCIENYLRYVETVVKRYKGRVKYWVPFNEQNSIIFDEGYMTGYKAKDRKELFKIEHHINLAYA